MHPAELRRWLKAHAMTQRELAKRLGVHEVTVSNWVRGMQPAPKWVPVALAGLHATLPKRRKP
jgi:transcriptional regulator with XRE-family HTH domain